WADSLETAIDMEPPTHLEEGISLPDDREYVFVFESELRSVTEGVEFEIYTLPEWDPLAAVLDERSTDEAIPLEKLATFNDMTREGASQAAEYITSMTGIETTVDISQCSFVPIEQVPAHVGETESIGVVLEYRGRPSGYLGILFDESSARTIADALVPVESDPEWDEMDRSAIKELGNIMTSGFIDGWANVLETSIEHSPPEFVHDMGCSIVSPIAAQLGTSQQHAFVIDSTVRTDDGAVSCSLYALPNERELMAALDDLLVERAPRTGADPDSVF
ncbi:MAG: chemotaxis protein CheC, partial [Halalkalicoccus sp.]